MFTGAIHVLASTRTGDDDDESDVQQQQHHDEVHSI